MTTQREFHELAVHVGALLDREAITVAEGGCIFAKFIQEQLGCSRVTIWLLDHQSDTAGAARTMRRFAGFDAVADSRITEPAELPDAECAAYFDALASEGAFVSDDCLADERLAAMRDSYLLPNDIRASMDATIAFNGAARGVICCAQQGAVRHWSRQELALLKRCAAEISLRRARRSSRNGAALDVVNELVQKMTAPR